MLRCGTVLCVRVCVCVRAEAEEEMEVDICAGRPCILVARYFYRHAHSSKLHSTHKVPVFVIPFRRFTCQPHNALLCISSRIQEDTVRNDADTGTRMIKVKFVLRRRCEFGQRFYVIGNDKLLGGWAPEAAIPMQWSEGHVWTLQLDLLSGTCAEFKVLLKADQVILEWQPGPNRRLKVSDSVTSLSVFVPWTDEEDSLENEAPQLLEMNDSQRTQDIVEIASSESSPSDASDNVGDADFKNDAIYTLDVTNEPKTEERSTDNEQVIFKTKDFVEKKQAGAKGRITGDIEMIDKGIQFNFEPSEDFLYMYPIPESWYAEDSSDIQTTSKFTEPSLETNATERALISATESAATKEEKAGEKTLLWDRAYESIAKAKNLEADDEHVSNKENGEQCMGEDAPVMDPSNVGTVLSNAEPEDVHKGSAQKAVTQDGTTRTFGEPKKEFIVDPAFVHNEEPTADEQFKVLEDTNEVSLKAAVDILAQNEEVRSQMRRVRL